jgi:hypothetical protein
MLGAILRGLRMFLSLASSETVLAFQIEARPPSGQPAVDAAPASTSVVAPLITAQEANEAVDATSVGDSSTRPVSPARLPLNQAPCGSALEVDHDCAPSTASVSPLSSAPSSLESPYEATTPKATTPKATTPKATTPKATTPKATAPKTAFLWPATVSSCVYDQGFVGTQTIIFAFRNISNVSHLPSSGFLSSSKPASLNLSRLK